VPVGAQGGLDGIELLRSAVAFRVVHLMPYTKKNAISQLEFAKG
jgi:hypothetical protein